MPMRIFSRLEGGFMNGRFRPIMLVSRGLSFGPPVTPRNFGKLFHIEPYKTTLDLETFNAHPRDKRIVYNDEDHTYYFDGNKLPLSVTQKVGSYFSEFDADTIAEKMMNGNNWPRTGYTHKNDVPFTKQEILKKWYKV